MLKLAEKGIVIKATGFYRADFDVKQALQQIVSVNPNTLVFGTDLPSTRSARPYLDDDYRLVVESVGEEVAGKVFFDNAIRFYRPRHIVGS